VSDPFEVETLAIAAALLTASRNVASVTMVSILIEGYAIVSADSMIATAEREMPPSIRNDADQHFFQDALDRAAVVVHGRHSHEGGPRADARNRLILTRRRVAALGPDSAHPHALLWNPAGASLEEALALLGIDDGVVAIIGGPDVFSLFLPQYDSFHLSRAPHARIPGGLPVFNCSDRKAGNPAPAGNPNSLDKPCCMNKRPTMMRKRLRT
jgi:dihydrofolate reductase